MYDSMQDHFQEWTNNVEFLEKFEYDLLNKKGVGVLRGLQIKTLLGYTNTSSSRTLIGQSNFLFIVLVLSLDMWPEINWAPNPYEKVATFTQLFLLLL